MKSVIVFLLFVAGCEVRNRRQADPQLQRDRGEFVQKLKDRGIIRKIDTPGTLPRLHVGPAFALADFESKQTFVSACYAFHFNLPRDNPDRFDGLMLVIDARTNKQIGTFTGIRGLTLD